MPYCFLDYYKLYLYLQPKILEAITKEWIVAIENATILLKIRYHEKRHSSERIQTGGL